ncbi:hypothetical protein L4X63_09415 [Geomonas sp. Red32]|uniref:hypothetical protein n=1 Tax=Geomonas sp. Red32 TaxID=2912856 RepID=UPI00202CD086|nr:hypothetical protein [Geomonas sp. Red32]MCM0081806.1 hypothetical protein [Geomonas sp. Red32]
MARGQHSIQQIIDNWNSRYPVGTSVILKRGNQDFYTQTTSLAYLNTKHPSMVVIDVGGLSGCYALDKVTAI